MEFKPSKRLLDREMEGWDNLILILEGKRSNEEYDQIFWIPEASGLFTNKSTSNLLHGSTNYLYWTLPKLIWGGNSPKKVKFFFCSLAHDSLNIKTECKEDVHLRLFLPIFASLAARTQDSRNHLFL